MWEKKKRRRKTLFEESQFTSSSPIGCTQLAYVIAVPQSSAAVRWGECDVIAAAYGAGRQVIGRAGSQTVVRPEAEAGAALSSSSTSV